ANPLFVELKEKAPGLLGSKRIKWNFTKFLVNAEGKILKRYAPTAKPSDIEKDIVKLLG
ncbi:MAG: glutathione peroxidase, partial [Pseudomonadota bacterium]|nr:glutathione peroxidase [Pseudomonadota bacterium]